MVSYLGSVMLAVSVLTSAPQPLEWQADYGKALTATRAGEQPLLVVLDKPQNADARIEPALLSEGASSGEESELLRPYCLCHVDVTSKYGQKVAKAFKADRFPYTAIIDKSGSVVIFAKTGPIDSGEWQQVLQKYRSGELPTARNTRTTQVSYKVIGDSSGASAPAYSNPNYCPSCQRRSM